MNRITTITIIQTVLLDPDFGPQVANVELSVFTSLSPEHLVHTVLLVHSSQSSEQLSQAEDFPMKYLVEHFKHVDESHWAQFELQAWQVPVLEFK